MLTGASGPATWGIITATLRSTRFVSRFNRAFVLGLMDGGFIEPDVDFINDAIALASRSNVWSPVLE